jgi:hypothetical protein
MKVTLKNAKKLVADIKEEFTSGNWKGSYSERVENTLLGFDNAFRSGDGNVGIILKNGDMKYLHFDIKL